MLVPIYDDNITLQHAEGMYFCSSIPSKQVEQKATISNLNAKICELSCSFKSQMRAYMGVFFQWFWAFFGDIVWEVGKPMVVSFFRAVISKTNAVQFRRISPYFSTTKLVFIGLFQNFFQFYPLKQLFYKTNIQLYVK